LIQGEQISIKKKQKLFIMSLFQDVESIEDHQVDANIDYELADIIFLTIAAVRECDGREHISFDGKVVCGFKHGEIDALQLMTAMVVENGLIIYQKETSTKSNEIPVMQSMLASMNIENAVITADAMHCQTKTTQLIRQGKGDYVLQVKKNQGKLLKEMEAYFHIASEISLKY